MIVFGPRKAPSSPTPICIHLLSLFVHLFSKRVLSTHCVPSTDLGITDTQEMEGPCSPGTYISIEQVENELTYTVEEWSRWFFKKTRQELSWALSYAYYPMVSMYCNFFSPHCWIVCFPFSVLMNNSAIQAPRTQKLMHWHFHFMGRGPRNRISGSRGILQFTRYC